MFTIVTGGNYRVFGPQATMIADNNQLAVALLMMLPLANYLRGQVADKRIAHLLLAGMVLTIIAIIGTYSRGAMIGLSRARFFRATSRPQQDFLFRYSWPRRGIDLELHAGTFL